MAHDHGHSAHAGHTHSVRVLTTDDCRRVDRLATEQYAIPPIILMENAGRSVAEHVTGLSEPDDPDPTVLVLAGHGNNGGDGLVAARHLSTFGARVGVILALPDDRLSGDTALNLAICRKFGIPVKTFSTDKPMAALRSLPAYLAKPDIVIDALLGTGQDGELREPYASLAALCNQLGDEGSAIVAVDIPTGLNADTGRAANGCVRAHMTVCMVAPKPGNLTLDGPAACGQFVEGEIGVPLELIERFGEVIEYECTHHHDEEEDPQDHDDHRTRE